MDAAVPNGEDEAPLGVLVGCPPKPKVAAGADGVDALFELGAPKLNVGLGLLSAAPGVAVELVLLDGAPNENVGLLAAAGAELAPKAEAPPNAVVEEAVDGAPKAGVATGVEEAPNDGVAEGVPKENKGLAVWPSVFAAVVCALPPKTEGEADDAPEALPNENADLGASAGFAASPDEPKGDAEEDGAANAEGAEDAAAPPKGDGFDGPDEGAPKEKVGLDASAGFDVLGAPNGDGAAVADVEPGALPNAEAPPVPNEKVGFGAAEVCASFVGGAPNGLVVFVLVCTVLVVLVTPKLNTGFGVEAVVEAGAAAAAVAAGVGAGAGAVVDAGAEGLEVIPKLNFGPLDGGTAEEELAPPAPPVVATLASGFPKDRDGAAEG